MILRALAQISSTSLLVGARASANNWSAAARMNLPRPARWNGARSGLHDFDLLRRQHSCHRQEAAILALWQPTLSLGISSHRHGDPARLAPGSRPSASAKLISECVIRS